MCANNSSVVQEILDSGGVRLTGQPFPECEVEIFRMPGGELHGVYRPLQFDAHDQPMLGGMFKRLNKVSIEKTGRPLSAYRIDA